MIDNSLVDNMSLNDWRRFMARFLCYNPNADRAWDILTCLRGPDYPSERPDMSPEESGRAYSERRKRKYDTVEVIRSAAFFGVVGGSARHHADDKVKLPPSSRWDHFDKHVARAANVLGLPVKTKGPDKTHCLVHKMPYELCAQMHAD